MKRYFLILIFILSFLLFSCGKNDKKTSETTLEETSESSCNEISESSDNESSNCAPMDSIGWGEPKFF